MDIKKKSIALGGIAFLAGVVATIVTALAVANRKHKSSAPPNFECESWENEL